MTRHYFFIGFTANATNGYSPLSGEPVDRHRRLGVFVRSDDDPILRLIADSDARRLVPTFAELIDRAGDLPPIGFARLSDAHAPYVWLAPDELLPDINEPLMFDDLLV